jgi:hypothetical protein
MLEAHLLPPAIVPIPSADQRGQDAVEQDSQQQHMQQPDRQQQQQQQQQQRLQPVGKPGKPSLPLAGGLKLTVGSNLETGEWKTGGVWKKDKAEHEAVPSNLQIISADDLVKVHASWLQQNRHYVASSDGMHSNCCCKDTLTLETAALARGCWRGNRMLAAVHAVGVPPPHCSMFVCAACNSARERWLCSVHQTCCQQVAADS